MRSGHRKIPRYLDIALRLNVAVLIHGKMAGIDINGISSQVGGKIESLAQRKIGTVGIQLFKNPVHPVFGLLINLHQSVGRQDLFDRLVIVVVDNGNIAVV